MKHDTLHPDPGCAQKITRLKENLKQMKAVAIAFSGGVDSVFLAAVAKESGLARLVAVTVDSCFVTREEIERAERLARQLGIDHSVVAADILASEEVAANPPSRCYFCKLKVFGLISSVAQKAGIPNLLHGVNLDDLGDYRPGLEAAREMEFKAPLLDAGFSKAEIRTCSRAMGLETWDLPSQSCLAARIPYHDPVTAEKLERIEAAEVFLKKMGFSQLRVRCHGDLARIEVDPEAFMAIAGDAELRGRISKALKRTGFAFVSLDLDGYRTGSMNYNINKEEQ